MKSELSTSPHLPRRRRGRRAFVLLEVLVSLAIMGIALSMVLRSFTVSLRAARYSERETMASILARDLMEQWEVKPPPQGFTEGKIGENHPGFSYELRYELEQIDYDNVQGLEEGRMAFLRLISLDIFHQPKRGGADFRKRMLHIESALTSAERFSGNARKNNEKGFDD